MHKSTFIYDRTDGLAHVHTNIYYISNLVLEVVQ